MTGRRGRLLWRFLAGAVGVLVLAIVLLPLLVPREHLRQLAQREVIAATGGEASLGPVSLRVLPRLRLVLGESSARVTAEGLRAAGQDPGPLVSADVALIRLEVDLALWPLLRRQFEFGEVRLIAPRLDLVTSPDDPDAPAVRPAAPIAEPGEIIPPTAMDYSLTLAAVEVRDGEVRWREDGSQRQVVLRGWQQDAAAPHFGVLVQRLLRLRGEPLPQDALDEPVTLDLTALIASLELQGFGQAPMPPLENLRLQGVLSLPPAADRADFTVRELSMTGWRATMAGHATADRLTMRELAVDGGAAVSLRGVASFAPPAHAGSMTCDLTGTVDLALILEHVAPWLPPMPDDAPPLPALTGSLDVVLAIDLAMPPPLDAPEAWAEAWREGLAGKATLSARGGPLSVATPQLGEPLRAGGLVLASDLRSRAGVTRLDLTEVEHPILRGDVVLEIRPAAGEDQAVRADLELPTLDLDALAELAEALQMAHASGGASQHAGSSIALVATAWAAQDRQGGSGGPSAAAAPLPGELIPPDLAVDLSATVREIVFLKSSYTTASVAGTLRERVIEVREFSARMGDGRVAGTARLDYAADPRGRASWDVRVDDAPAALLLSPYLPILAEIWTGALSARVAGACDLADPKAILNSLDLAGDLHGSSGLIDLREQLGGIRQYLGDRQDLLSVHYRRLDQRFKVQEGKVHVEDLRIDGRDTDWRGGGWIGLDGTLNLDLNVRLPAGFTPSLGDLTFLADALRDQDGRIGLDIALTGDLRRPAAALVLDPATLLQSERVKSMLEETLKDAMQDETGEQLKKLQDEIKKGADGLLDRLRRGR